MTKTYAYPLPALGVTREAVVRECGGVGEALASLLDDTIDALLDQAAAQANPRAGYVLTTERFDTGPVIADLVAGATRFAVFLATLGVDFDRWSQAFFEAHDPFQGYLASAIGSVAVEAAVDRIETVIEAEAGGEGVTNRVSPGYCGWDVADQHRLFRLLPEDFLGVSLTRAALMVPLKSVSGVIGIGTGVEKHPYPCAVCTVDACPTGGRRRR